MQLGNFEVRFESDAEQAVAIEEDLERTVVLRPKKKPAAIAAKTISPKIATLHFFRGPNKGDSKIIDRSLYTIGQPGGEVAAIARRSQGFYLLPITSSSHPKINNIEIEGGSGVQLSEGDVVEVGDNLAEISFKANRLPSVCFKRRWKSRVCARNVRAPLAAISLTDKGPPAPRVGSVRPAPTLPVTQ
jgi:hypothetical protein